MTTKTVNDCRRCGYPSRYLRDGMCPACVDIAYSRAEEIAGLRMQLIRMEDSRDDLRARLNVEKRRGYGSQRGLIEDRLRRIEADIYNLETTINSKEVHI